MRAAASTFFTIEDRVVANQEPRCGEASLFRLVQTVRPRSPSGNGVLLSASMISQICTSSIRCVVTGSPGVCEAGQENPPTRGDCIGVHSLFRYN